jgi:hypothetical protein
MQLIDRVFLRALDPFSDLLQFLLRLVDVATNVADQRCFVSLQQCLAAAKQVRVHVLLPIAGAGSVLGPGFRARDGVGKGEDVA